MGITTYETCNPIHSMSIIHLHGELDNVIYIDGGDEYLPLEDNGTTSGVVTTGRILMSVMFLRRKYFSQRETNRFHWFLERLQRWYGNQLLEIITGRT